MQNFRINQAMASFLTLDNAARFYDMSMALSIAGLAAGIMSPTSII